MTVIITAHQRQAMLDNGVRSARGEDIDPQPVVKLFTPDAGATWLLTELDPEDPDIAFGLCEEEIIHDICRLPGPGGFRIK